MLTTISNKSHPEFDLASARRIFTASGHDNNLRGELITSPYDLFSVEELRDRHKLRVKDAFATDVFVYGKGEPPRRDCTKVGGLPYWPHDRPWPKDVGGRNYRFLAQFNFCDSGDLFENLPGSMLLLMVREGEEWRRDPSQIHLEWLPLGFVACPTFDLSLIAVTAGPFFGTIFRSADYPYAVQKAQKLKVRGAFNLPILSGTKIGGLPDFVISGQTVKGEFICQLGSIQPEAECPYPWVNTAQALELDATDAGIYGRSNSFMYGDMGSIYIFRYEDGTFGAMSGGH